MSCKQQQLLLSQYLLYYYNVECIEQLISIMLDPLNSSTYIYIKNYRIPHMQLQNLTSVKSIMLYKRELLIEKIYSDKQLIKFKINHQNSINQNGKQIQDNIFQKIRLSINSNLNNNKIHKYINNKKNKQYNHILQTSHYSYEQLENYFATNNDALLCKNILQEKYSRKQFIYSFRTRKLFWMILIGIDRKREQYPAMYETLTNYTNYHDFYGRIIHADVIRTVHDTKQKIKKQKIIKMQKILLNYARRNPYIGYCQGMNFILYFLMDMQFEEEECFWILTTILEQITHMGYYTDMSGVAADIKIISHILKKMHPEISKKLSKIEIDLSVFVLQWLVCLYTSTLTFPVLLIVWDMLLIEGAVVLVKVALVLLEQLKPIILEAKDFNHFFKLYESQKRNIYIEEQKFIQRLNNIYIDNRVLPLVRQIIQKQLKKTKEQLYKKITFNDKWKDVKCNVEWPICFQQLKKQKLNDIQFQVWILKEQNKPKIIIDYMNNKQRKSVKPAQDNRQKQKKLVIGRLTHICQQNYSQKVQSIISSEQSGRELDVMTTKYVDKLTFNNSYLSPDKQSDISKSNINPQNWNDFYRRVTANNVGLNQILSYNVGLQI